MTTGARSVWLLAHSKRCPLRCLFACRIPGPLRCLFACRIPGPLRCLFACRTPGPLRCLFAELTCPLRWLLLKLTASLVITQVDCSAIYLRLKVTVPCPFSPVWFLVRSVLWFIRPSPVYYSSWPLRHSFASVCYVFLCCLYSSGPCRLVGILPSFSPLYLLGALVDMASLRLCHSVLCMYIKFTGSRQSDGLVTFIIQSLLDASLQLILFR